MIGNYLRVTEETLNELLEEPSRISNVIYPEEETPEWVERRLDIDKSWHIIHFLLNGKEWEGEKPYVFAVLGGATISDEDVGYGPARFLLPSEVKLVANALESMPAEALLKRWNQKAIDRAEIYPQSWSQCPEDFEYIGGNYELLREFFALAAKRDEAVIEWIS